MTDASSHAGSSQQARPLWNDNLRLQRSVGGLRAAARVGAMALLGLVWACSDSSTAPRSVSEVIVLPGSVTLEQGQMEAFTAILHDADGNTLTGREVEWSSSNKAVATVSSGGLVTAVGLGEVLITGVAESESGTALVTVIPVPVAQVIVSPGSVTLDEGEVEEFTATMLDAGGNSLSDREVVWSSSNDAVATISTVGVVTAVQGGDAMITAESEGQSGTAVVTVHSIPVAEVIVTPNYSVIVEGQMGQLSATLLDAGGDTLTGREVAWSSSNEAVATVNSHGIVTGVAVGDSWITGASDSESGTALVTVIPVPVAEVVVSPASVALEEGQSEEFTATLLDAGGDSLSDREVHWSSSDETVATVSTGGLVTAVQEGEATITAESEWQIGTAAVTVTPKRVIGQGYVARNGMTVRLNSLTTTNLGNGYRRYEVTYTQVNHTATAIPEGTMKLYFHDADPMPQFGFFNEVLPGPAFALTRSYSFDAPSGDAPWLLQYDHNHFFAADPVPGAVQWSFPVQ